MKSLAARLTALLFCLWAALAGAAPGGDGLVAIPPLTARVTDLTGTLSAGQKAALEQRLAEFEARKGAQVVVLMLPTTQPETIEQFGIRLFDAWKVGRQGVDDGVLLIVAKNDRRLRIEVGYGLEGVLNDATAKRIVADVITPRFSVGDFHGGIAAGVDAILKVVDGEALPAPKAGAGASPGSGRAQGGGGAALSDISETLLYGLLLAIVIGGAILRFVLGNFLGSTLVGALTGGLGWLFVGGLTGIIGGFLLGLLLALFGFDLILAVLAAGNLSCLYSNSMRVMRASLSFTKAMIGSSLSKIG